MFTPVFFVYFIFLSSYIFSNLFHFFCVLYLILYFFFDSFLYYISILSRMFAVDGFVNRLTRLRKCIGLNFVVCIVLTSKQTISSMLFFFFSLLFLRRFSTSLHRACAFFHFLCISVYTMDWDVLCICGDQIHSLFFHSLTLYFVFFIFRSQTLMFRCLHSGHKRQQS